MKKAKKGRGGRRTFERPATHVAGCYPAVCRGVKGISDCAGECPTCGSEACSGERWQAYAAGGDVPPCKGVQ